MPPVVANSHHADRGRKIIIPTNHYQAWEFLKHKDHPSGRKPNQSINQSNQSNNQSVDHQPVGVSTGIFKFHRGFYRRPYDSIRPDEARQNQSINQSINQSKHAEVRAAHLTVKNGRTQTEQKFVQAKKHFGDKFGYESNQSINQSVNQSHQIDDPSISQSINQSNQSIKSLILGTGGRSDRLDSYGVPDNFQGPKYGRVYDSTNQSINQSINQSPPPAVNRVQSAGSEISGQSINQSINRSKGRGRGVYADSGTRSQIDLSFRPNEPHD